MKFSDFKLGAKLGTAFTAVVVLTAAVGGFALLQMSRLNGNTTDIAGNWLPSVISTTDIRGALNVARTTEVDLVLAVDAKQSETAQANFTKAIQRLDEVMTKYEGQITSDAERENYNDLKNERVSYDAAHRKLAELAAGGQFGQLAVGGVVRDAFVLQVVVVLALGVGGDLAFVLGHHLVEALDGLGEVRLGGLGLLRVDREHQVDLGGAGDVQRAADVGGADDAGQPVACDVRGVAVQARHLQQREAAHRGGEDDDGGERGAEFRTQLEVGKFHGRRFLEGSVEHGKARRSARG